MLISVSAGETGNSCARQLYEVAPDGRSMIAKDDCTISWAKSRQIMVRRCYVLQACGIERSCASATLVLDAHLLGA